MSIATESAAEYTCESGNNRPTLFLLLLSMGVCSNILSFLSPNEGIDLLTSHNTLIFSKSCWDDILELCQLKEFVPRFERYFNTYHPRKFVVHAIRRLGYLCLKCYTPLNGPNGIFACTTLCSSCALKKFTLQKEPYVSATIRFYLCGEDTLTTSGKAVLIEPYWVSDDDNSGEMKQVHGSLLDLAQKIYEEKVVFAVTDLLFHRINLYGNMNKLDIFQAIRSGRC